MPLFPNQVPCVVCSKPFNTTKSALRPLNLATQGAWKDILKHFQEVHNYNVNGKIHMSCLSRVTAHFTNEKKNLDQEPTNYTVKPLPEDSRKAGPQKSVRKIAGNKRRRLATAKLSSKNREVGEEPTVTLSDQSITNNLEEKCHTSKTTGMSNEDDALNETSEDDYEDNEALKEIRGQETVGTKRFKNLIITDSSSSICENDSEDESCSSEDDSVVFEKSQAVQEFIGIFGTPDETLTDTDSESETQTVLQDSSCQHFDASIPSRIRQFPPLPSEEDAFNEEVSYIQSSIEYMYPDLRNSGSWIKLLLNNVINKQRELPWVYCAKRNSFPCDFSMEFGYKVLELHVQYIKWKEMKEELFKIYKEAETKLKAKNHPTDNFTIQTLSEALSKHTRLFKFNMELSDMEKYMWLFKTPIDKPTGKSIGIRKPKTNFSEDSLRLKIIPSLFGLYPHEIGANIALEKQAFSVSSVAMGPKESPSLEIYASEKSKFFEICKRLSLEPTLRAKIRSDLWCIGKINCFPTEKGINEIEEDYPCFTFRYLKDKPITSFINDQFLLLKKAENDGLVKFKLTENICQDLADNVKCFILDNNDSQYATAWNEIRQKYLYHTIRDHVLDQCWNEIQNILMKQCFEFVIECSTKKFKKLISTAPYKVDFLETDSVWDTKLGVKVLAISYSGENPKRAEFCLLDRDGEIDNTIFAVDDEKHEYKFIEVAALLKGSIQHDNDERRKLYNLLVKAKPHVVAISGASYAALRLQKIIKELLHNISEDHKFPVMPTEIVQNEISSVYGKSVMAMEREKDSCKRSELFLEAVSLGRFLQNPLYETCQLFNPNNDICKVIWHELQDSVSENELLEKLECELVAKVCEVGVDMTKVPKHHHLTHALKFVSGLCKDTAPILISFFREIQSSDVSHSTILLSESNIDESIIENCAHFLKYQDKPVCIPHFPKDMRETFKSPDPYSLCEILTKIPVEKHLGSIYDAKVVRVINEKTDFVKTSQESTIIFCNYCKGQFPDKNTAEQHFDQVVCKKGVSGVRVYISPFNVPGFIPFSRLQVADQNVSNLIGETVKVRVLKFDPKRMNFVVSPASTDLKDFSGKYNPTFDEYFDKEAKKIQQQHNTTLNKQNISSTDGLYISRAINHSHFANIDHKTAMDRLKVKASGDILYHPSSKGVDYLTATWKMTDTCFCEIIIRESNKECLWSLGKKLMIDRFIYNDLDDIEVNHVKPMNDLVAEIVNHEHYCSVNDRGNRDDPIYSLKYMHLQNQSSTPYLLQLSEKYPGYARISYFNSGTVISGYIEITPIGLRYRGMRFESVSRLLNYISENYIKQQRKIYPKQVPAAPEIPNIEFYGGGFGIDASGKYTDCF